MVRRVTLLCCAIAASSCSATTYYASFSKIDAHVHINTLEPHFSMLAEREGFRLMTLVTRSLPQRRARRARRPRWKRHSSRRRAQPVP